MEPAIIVDVETTGLSVQRGGRVIEIGAVLIQDGRIAAEMETLINCDAPISRSAFRIHGITRQMLHAQPKPEDVWPNFLNIIGNSPLIAHNAPFDSAFIRHELSLCNLPLPNTWHCTVRLSRKKLPHLPDHKLDTVYRYLFGALPQGSQRHRALDDARLAARIWMELA